jgi:hypothetical protein
MRIGVHAGPTIGQHPDDAFASLHLKRLLNGQRSSDRDGLRAW